MAKYRSAIWRIYDRLFGVWYQTKNGRLNFGVPVCKIKCRRSFFRKVKRRKTAFLQAIKLARNYHNVVIYQKQEGSDIGDVLLWPFNVFFKKGYKQFWMEYDGTAELGVDLRKNTIRIYDPDENNVVDIYVPDASVIDVKADRTTMSEPLDETGLFTALTGEERMDALNAS